MAKERSKLVQKGTQVQQGDRDRLIMIVNWATVEDPLQVRFELDAAIDEVSNEDHEHKKGSTTPQQVTKLPSMEKEVHSSSPVCKIVPRMKPEATEWKKRWQVGEEVQEI